MKRAGVKRAGVKKAGVKKAGTGLKKAGTGLKKAGTGGEEGGGEKGGGEEGGHRVWVLGSLRHGPCRLRCLGSHLRICPLACDRYRDFARICA